MTNPSRSVRAKKGFRRIGLVVAVPALALAVIAGTWASWRAFDPLYVLVGGDSYSFGTDTPSDEISQAIIDARARRGLSTARSYDAEIWTARIRHSNAYGDLAVVAATSAVIGILWFALWEAVAWVVRGFMND